MRSSIVAVLGALIALPLASASVEPTKSYADPAGDVEANDGSRADAPELDFLSLATEVDGDDLLVQVRLAAAPKEQFQLTAYLYVSPDLHNLVVTATSGMSPAPTVKGWESRESDGGREFPATMSIADEAITLRMARADVLEGALCFEPSASIFGPDPQRRYVGDAVGWRPIVDRGSCSDAQDDEADPAAHEGPTRSNAAEPPDQERSTADVRTPADADDSDASSDKARETPAAPLALVFCACVALAIVRGPRRR